MFLTIFFYFWTWCSNIASKWFVIMEQLINILKPPDIPQRQPQISNELKRKEPLWISQQKQRGERKSNFKKVNVRSLENKLGELQNLTKTLTSCNKEMIEQEGLSTKWRTLWKTQITLLIRLILHQIRVSSVRGFYRSVVRQTCTRDPFRPQQSACKTAF